MQLRYKTPEVITSVEGVKCSGVRIKGGGLGLVVCDGKAAGVFTTNKFKAAPVIVTENHLKKGYIKGIIVNSGNANAYTGEQGIKNAIKMAELLAEKIGCSREEIVVSSTGVIGVQLDIKWIGSLFNSAYPQINSSRENSWKFAKSITTTDSFTKQWGVKVGDCVVAGVAKGAGMIAPNMATMLAYVFTDAKIDCEGIIKKVVKKTFNSITVDGDTSTNDSFILVSTEKKECDEKKIEEAIMHVCSVLAEMIAADGEGASKLMRVFVRGAKNDVEAEKAARAVASSILVKTALFGCDANWGRVIAALGYSDVEINENLDLDIVGCKWDAEDAFRGGKGFKVELIKNGKDTGKRSLASKLMRENEVVEYHIDLKVGNGKSCIVGCDLNHNYVKINSEYTT